jgi:anti-sigma B factor antagonist
LLPRSADYTPVSGVGLYTGVLSFSSGLASDPERARRMAAIVVHAFRGSTTVQAPAVPIFSIDVRPERSRAVLAPSGEIDIGAVPRLGDALDELWGVGWKDVVIDVGGVSFIDSTGLAFLVSACRSAALNGHRLTVAGSCPALERVASMCKLETAIPRS